MRRFRMLLSLLLGLSLTAAWCQDAPRLVLPLERTAYFINETVPLAVTGAGAVKVELVNADGRVLLYEGRPGPLLWRTAGLAPGDYTVEVNGVKVLDRFTLTTPLRRSCASLQDEATPNPPNFDSRKQKPEEYAVTVRNYWEYVTQASRETGLTMVVALAQSDAGRFGYLDTLARTGTMVMSNDDTRPTSFNPGTLDPTEMDGMSQRMILTAQANGRYPNFAGFCFAWDPCGYAVGARRMLLIYWGWGDKADDLRDYINRIDRFKQLEFIRRTGLEPVTEKDYVSYLLRTKQADLAPTVDLPVHVWLREMASAARPMPAPEREAFEKRLDAWAAYMMSMYGDVYGAYVNNLKRVDPSLQYTGSIQIDHCSTRQGQYFPAAYAPLSLRYQSTWNDQVGGPDYNCQWLLTQGLLDMERGRQPTWISNAIAAAHHRADYPGKFTRVAAHGLAYGGSGIGFACEAFSNLLGGMNAASNWSAIKGKSGGADLLAGRDFLDRFAGIALAGKARNGVGILFSRTQYGRQNVVPAFGSAPFQTFITLSRLGYTPCFLTEDDLVNGRQRDVKAIVLLGQTVPLPQPVADKLAAFAAAGGRLLGDGNTTVTIPGLQVFPHKFALSPPGKPHNWGVPNMPAGENDVTQIAAAHRQLAPVLDAALGGVGRTVLVTARGAETEVSRFTISGGADATYVVAVNDSSIKTQADWYQVKEQLTPAAGINGQLYDCTAEQDLGALAPFACDLTATTARVYAILPRPLKTSALAATQKLRAGEDLLVSVEFHDAAGKRLAAVLPFQLSIMRPDGKAFQSFYRTTASDGNFSMAVPVPANAPTGDWTVVVRSQLNGSLTTLPVTVSAGKAASPASALSDATVVRETDAIDEVLKRGSRILVPIFPSPQANELAGVAEQLKTVLAKRGVTAEIKREPEVGTYTLGYSLSAWEEAQNARIDRGEAIGRIKRATVNGNDWYSAASGWRCGQPVILLDLVPSMTDPTEKPLPPANPMALSLARIGALWPTVSADFPGTGKAVIQLVHWAFSPRVPAIIIQATDAAGLAAGVAALAKLPEDSLTPGIRKVKTELWQQYHVGGEPAMPVARGLSSKGLKTAAGSQAFAIEFPGNLRPPTPDQVQRPERAPFPATTIPATFMPKQYTVFYRVGDQFIESATAGMLVPDLRFSEAIRLVLDVQAAGKTKVVAAGVFRYSDRLPCSQAQWEDYLELRKQWVRVPRKPMAMDVMLDGRSIGKLAPTKTGEVKVMTRWTPLPSEYALEEVVTELAGEVDLPAGRQEVLLVPQNVVDGQLSMVGVGMDPVAPPPPDKKK